MRYITLIFPVLIFSLFISCETWRQDCEGQINVNNSIPDTTMYLGDDPWRIDLVEQKIFEHTLNKTMHYQSFSPFVGKNGWVVQDRIIENPKTGERQILEITPNSIGDAEVEVQASDNCPDYWQSVVLNVRVREKPE